MPNPPKQLNETHVIGPETIEAKVRAQECPALGLHHIAHVGLADAAAPYEMVRMDLSGTYLLSCSAGRGQILLDGKDITTLGRDGSDTTAVAMAAGNPGFGAVAQLGERRVRNAEVRGSIPLGSTRLSK